MSRSDIDRCALATLPVAAASGLLLWRSVGTGWALCFVLSTLWGAANLWLLGRILLALLSPRGNPARAVTLVLLKPAVLFGGGTALALSPIFSPSAMLIGFHVAIALAAIQALGGRHADSEALAEGRG